VEDVDEKLWAMELITNSVVPDRWKHTRVPPNNAEMQSTQILKVKVCEIKLPEENKRAWESAAAGIPRPCRNHYCSLEQTCGRRSLS
jgi:hypothetical protein